MAITPWDKLSSAQRTRLQSTLLRQTLLQQALGAVPYVRARLTEAGIDPRLLRGLGDLHRIPATLRRDVFDPSRNPAGAAGLLLEGTEEGLKRFSDRRELLRVARARLAGGLEAQQAAVDAITKPMHLHAVPGRYGTIPVGYTREDLVLLARAGGRLAALLRLGRGDTMLNLVPFGATLDFWGIFYLAYATGMTAVHPAPDAAASAAAGLPGGRPTVVAVSAREAAAFPAFAAGAGIDLSQLRMLIVVGGTLPPEERARTGGALASAGAPGAAIGCVYGPAEGRVLWSECAVPAGATHGYGLHTYPDMEIVEVLSPETGEPAGHEAPGELTITPLGFRGGGAPRWRTGELVTGGLTVRPCPNCGRTAPRVGPGVVEGAWDRPYAIGDGAGLDLREIGVAVSAYASDWQAELVGGANGTRDLFVYASPRGDAVKAVLAMHAELSRAGLPPAQIVLAEPGALAERRKRASGDWDRFWERGPRGTASSR